MNIMLTTKDVLYNIFLFLLILIFNNVAIRKCLTLIHVNLFWLNEKLTRTIIYNEFYAEIMMNIIKSLMMINHVYIISFQTSFYFLLKLIFQFHSRYMKTILLYWSKEKRGSKYNIRNLNTPCIISAAEAIWYAR